MKAHLQDVSIDNFDLSLSRLRISKPNQVTDVEIRMTKQGQLQPLAVRQANGRYQIIDGFKRYYAAMEMALNTLQCYILDVVLQQAKILALSFNRAGRSMDIWEEAMILSDLASSHGLSQKSLAKLTGYSRSWISRRLSLIGKLSEALITEIRMNTLSSTHARALIKLPRGNQMEVADVITHWKLSSRQCDLLVEAYLKATDRAEQQHLLVHPELTLTEEPPTFPCSHYDPELSDFGNELMNGTREALSFIEFMLCELGAEQINRLVETEKAIAVSELTTLSGAIQKLIYKVKL